MKIGAGRSYRSSTDLAGRVSCGHCESSDGLASGLVLVEVKGGFRGGKRSKMARYRRDELGGDAACAWTTVTRGFGCRLLNGEPWKPAEEVPARVEISSSNVGRPVCKEGWFVVSPINELVAAGEVALEATFAAVAKSGLGTIRSWSSPTLVGLIKSTRAIVGHCVLISETSCSAVIMKA